MLSQLNQTNPNFYYLLQLKPHAKSCTTQPTNKKDVQYQARKKTAIKTIKVKPRVFSHQKRQHDFIDKQIIISSHLVLHLIVFLFTCKLEILCSILINDEFELHYY